MTVEQLLDTRWVRYVPKPTALRTILITHKSTGILPSVLSNRMMIESRSLLSCSWCGCYGCTSLLSSRRFPSFECGACPRYHQRKRYVILQDTPLQSLSLCSSGDLIHLDRDQSNTTWLAATTSLGLLGVIARVKMAILADYKVYANQTTLDEDDVLNGDIYGMISPYVTANFWVRLLVF